VAILGSLAVSGLLVASANPIHPIFAQFAPDLRPANLALSPVPAYEGDTVEVTVTVVNVGDTTAVSATIDLTDSRPNGEVISIGQTLLADPLAPGASTLVRTPKFFAVGAGEHTLTIRVGNVTPVEANGGNDALSMWMQVLPAKAPPPPPPSDGVRVEALATLGFGAFVGFLFVIGIIAVVVVLLSRREPYAAVPPPPEPPDRSPPPIWPP
jgi:hypothetical protein